MAGNWSEVLMGSFLSELCNCSCLSLLSVIISLCRKCDTTDKLNLFDNKSTFFYCNIKYKKQNISVHDVEAQYLSFRQPLDCDSCKAPTIH